jgi:hypothetical protein
MSRCYKLDGHTPVVVDNLIEWATWFEDADRQVGLTDMGDGVRVSTVFLGLDHSFYGGAPILFETMVFGGPHDQLQKRCATWEEAAKLHEETVQLVREP